MTLDTPDEDVAGIVFTETLEVRVEAVTIHFNVQAAPLTFGTDLHHSALDFCSHWKNCVVRDQGFAPFKFTNSCCVFLMNSCWFFMNVCCVFLVSACSAFFVNACSVFL